MARENNFLLGYGERLTSRVTIPGGGGPKEPPYEFNIAKTQFSSWLSNSSAYFQQLPSEACPDDQVTALITMHPRYVSKSDFPRELLDSVGLRAVGGRTKRITPKEWGIQKHPTEAVTDQIFVVGTRNKLSKWAKELPQWNIKSKGSTHLAHIENFGAFKEDDKIKQILVSQEELLLEVVLHESINRRIIEQFESFVKQYDAKPIMDRIRSVKGLTFIPVYTNKEQVSKIAQFSFIRVLRAMPTMRPLHPNPLRQTKLYPISLPEESEIDPSLRVAIFDGGLPDNSPISKWVNLIEPSNIGSPVPAYQQHGLATTSAILFGPLDINKVAPRPLCNIDHIRVLDNNTGKNGDFEYYDVLDRISEILNQPDKSYDFINLSLGPQMPVSDDEITRWTAELDQRLAGGKTLTTVAVGNDGELDSASGLNRIQPPSDAINVLSVGAANNNDALNWGRAEYSCVGPGRCPGFIKPDGIIFGGSDDNPFLVVSPNDGVAVGVCGTSFASPYALRTGISVKTQLGDYLSPLAIRALLIHRAVQSTHELIDVGWGRFENDYARLITCDDDEALVLYQGDLPVKDHLRAPVPLPDSKLAGNVFITATLIISPEIDPSYPNTYTRGGLEVAFRPNATKFKTRDDGTTPDNAATKSFFSAKNLYKAGEYTLREEGKWEPCLKRTQKFQSKTLKESCFDIYYHSRDEATALSNPDSIPFALVVSVKAPKVINLYEQVVRTYLNILVPIQPKVRIQVRN